MCCRLARCLRSSRAGTTGSRKFTGYEYSEFFGNLHFALTFIGANILFFPQHFLGNAGMPRHYADYPEAFAYWNKISSYGSYITALGTLVFFVGVAYSFMRARKAAGNPWGPSGRYAGVDVVVAAALPRVRNAAGHQDRSASLI